MNIGGNLSMSAGNDFVAQDTQINAAGGVDISAGNDATITIANKGSFTYGGGNQTNFIAAIDSREISQSSGGRNFHWQVNQSQGSKLETLHMTQVNVPVGMTNFVGAGGISVQLPKQSNGGSSLATQIETLSKLPGNEYLVDLANRKDIDWQQVDVINKTWDHKKEGLTQEAAIIVAIVVTIFTAGAASTAAGSLVGTGTTAAGATTITAGGLAATTGMSVAVAAGMTTAVAAGITTLATQATIALINSQGDISAALKELGSKENVKQLVTAMATAGLVQGLSSAFNLPTGTALAKASFVDKLQTNIINGVASSLVTTAINGGNLEDALKNAIKNAVISTVAAQGANAIGDAKFNGDLDLFSGTLAHAILGCGMGAATTGNSSGCAAGAAGAVIGDLSAEWYGRTFGGNPANAADFAKLTTALVAAAAGGASAMNVAGITSNNAVVNNYLSHTDAAQREYLKDKLRKGQSLTPKEQQTLSRLEILDIATDLALQDACKTQGDACNSARRDLNAVLSTYSGAGAMYDARLSPAANAAIFAERDAAARLGNDPRLAQQTQGDAFLETGVPQIAGYAAGAVVGKFITAAAGIYAARSAQSVNAANVQLALDELATAAQIGTVRADLGEHLTKAGASRTGNIAGGHDAIAFDAALARVGGRIVSEVQTAPGIFKVEYITAAGNPGTKTIYDPRMYPDMTNNASLAANKALIEYGKTGVREQTVVVNGISFFAPVTVPRSGIPYVPTAYPKGVVK
jgi:hypothetical protein